MAHRIGGLILGYKKNSSKEELNLNQKYKDIIAYNAQVNNEYKCFFNKNVLKLATKTELIKLTHLAEELKYKWCIENINYEFKRRAV